VFGNSPEGVAAPTMTFFARSDGCSPSIPTTDEKNQLAASNSVSLWAQLAITGNPSIEGLIEWPQYTETNNRYLDIAAALEAKEGIESAFVAPPAN
jgi:carboxylesterase type B